MPLLLVASIAAVLSAAAAADTQRPVGPAIILIGDSTMTRNAGWGGAFCDEHVVEGIDCLDLAVGGTGLRDFRSKGYLASTLAEISRRSAHRPWVLVQFGINDSRGRTEARSDPQTFAIEMAQYVAEIRAAGGYPVVVTTLAERRFRMGHHADLLEPWARSARVAAVTAGAPLVDLYQISGNLFDRVGIAKALTFGTPGLETKDGIHLGPNGAREIASTMVEGIRMSVPKLGLLLR